MESSNYRDQLALNIVQNFDAQDFWLNKFSGDLVKSRFPYDNNRTDRNEYSIKVLKFRFHHELYSRLIKLSNNSLPRLLMILTAGLMSLLFKYSGNRDIIIGTTIFKQEIEGEYINTVLPLRNQLKNSMTFKELLIQVREILYNADENQNYPIELLLQKLKLPFSKDDDFPLFDVAILLENIQDKSYIQYIKPNVLFTFRQIEEHIEGGIEYNSSLYDKTTIERLTTHFKLLLHQVCIDVDKELGAIDILTEKEKKQLIEFNNTEAYYPKNKTIHELFEQQVEKTPENIAIQHCPQKKLTYRELNDRADQLAKSLKKRGVVHESIVGILAENSLGIIVAIMGILKVGGAYLPIDSVYPGERKKYILEDSGTSLLLTHKGLTDHLSWRGSIINIDDILSEQINYTAPCNKDVKPSDLAYVIYTSGSTGKPKGVMIEHQGLVNYIWGAAKNYVRNRKVSFPLYSSLSFDLTATSIFTPLITGNTILVYGAEDKGLLIQEIIDDNKVGMIKLTPSHLKLIREKKIGGSNSNVKTLIVGGEELESSLARDISEIFKKNIEIYNEYGPTETVVGSMIYKFDNQEDNRQSVPIGVPVDNVQIYILDKKQEPVPVGAIGEIYISGEGVARGYLNQPELTMEKFVANPFIPGKRMYTTGDLARFLGNGNIEYKGRIDHQVMISGFRIELGEIANTLLEHENIKEAIVIAHEKSGSSESANQYLCAYIVPDSEITESHLIEYLDKKLPGYMIPSYFISLEQIPLTSNGKVHRKSLPVPEGIRPNLKATYVAPKSDVEKIMADAWKQVLKLDKIGIHDNFFDLGGNSLDIIKVNNKLNEIFNRDISVVDMFRYTTISSFAGYLSQKKQGAKGSEQKANPTVQVNQIKKQRAQQKQKRKRR